MRNWFFGSMVVMVTSAGLALAQSPATAPASRTVVMESSDQAISESGPETVAPAGSEHPAHIGHGGCSNCGSCDDGSCNGGSCHGRAGRGVGGNGDLTVTPEYLNWFVGPDNVPVLGTRTNYGDSNGVRITASSALDAEQNSRCEFSGFYVGFGRNNVTAAVGPVGTVATGDLFNRVFGVEGDLYCRYCAVYSDRFELMAGARYLNIHEDANIGSTAGPLGAFTTTNQFYGPQVGLRASFLCHNFFADLKGKFAFGDIHQSADTISGGIVSHLTRDKITYIPEVTVNFGYQLNDQARIFVGYNFMYVNNVLSVGTPSLGGFFPEPWTMQGVNIGLECHF